MADHYYLICANNEVGAEIVETLPEGFNEEYIRWEGTFDECLDVLFGYDGVADQEEERRHHVDVETELLEAEIEDYEHDHCDYDDDDE